MGHTYKPGRVGFGIETRPTASQNITGILPDLDRGIKSHLLGIFTTEPNLLGKLGALGSFLFFLIP